LTLLALNPNWNKPKDIILKKQRRFNKKGLNETGLRGDQFLRVIGQIRKVTYYFSVYTQTTVNFTENLGDLTEISGSLGAEYEDGNF
jgi:hypothetical protein